MTYRILVALFVAALFAAPTAQAQDAGRAFDPKPLSQPRFAAGPTESLAVAAGDGTRIHYEVTRPVGTGVPARVPVILMMTPYAGPDTVAPEGQRHANTIAYFTARGYAVAIGHARGYGNSDGCPDPLSAAEIDATARVIEALGRAPWSSGRVGMYGLSYDAILATNVAARGDATRTKYLKAIVPVAGGASLYELSFLDGVPLVGSPTSTTAAYQASITLLPAAGQRPEAYAGRLGCAGDTVPPSVEGELSGDYTRFWGLRDSRAYPRRIKAATLFAYGTKDLTVMPVASGQMLGRMARGTPAVMVLGQWEHGFPDAIGANPRADWQAIAQAWFDDHLMGLDVRTERWPRVQVQDSTGQWRSERSWPASGGPSGQLALSAGGELGVSMPAGETAFTDSPVPGGHDRALFRTAPLRRELHLTGAMTLDLWLVLERARTRVAVQLVALDADGQPVPGQPPVFGARSAQHLEPMRAGYFGQERARDPQLGTPVRVPVRVGPSDLRIPAGGTLEIRVAGSLFGVPTLDTTPNGTVPTTPSGSVSTVRILHGCRYLSVLRFRTADPRAELINVREADETGSLASTPVRRGAADGGLNRRVCGRPPGDPAAPLGAHRRR